MCARVRVFFYRNNHQQWINQMDPHGLVSQKVYRDGTRYINGKHVKDLTALNRPLSQVVIVDNNPDCISMQVHILLHVFPSVFFFFPLLFFLRRVSSVSQRPEYCRHSLLPVLNYHDFFFVCLKYTYFFILLYLTCTASSALFSVCLLVGVERALFIVVLPPAKLHGTNKKPRNSQKKKKKKKNKRK